MYRHTRIQKVLSEGFNFNNVFLVDEGREDPNTTIFKWRFAGVPMMAQN